MRGHVRKRGATWSVVIDVGRDDDGRRRQKWQGGFRTKKDAERALVRSLQLSQSGGDPFPETITVRRYTERWLEHQQGRLRPHTLRRYRQVLRDHIVPVIGNLVLTRVRPAHVQLVLDGVAAKGLAPRSAVETRAILSSAFRQAMEWGLSTSNPVQAVRPPRQPRPQLVIPTAMDLSALMEGARGTIWEAPVVLAASTGARRAEVLGLRWADLDNDTGRVRITRSLQRVRSTSGTELVFLDPKTDRARRQVTLTTTAVDWLRRHRTDQAARRLVLGPGWHDLDLICDRGDGAPFDPDAFTRAFRRLAAKAGLPQGMRLHDVRHGVATALLGQGVHPAIASAVLGHASPAFTMSVYQHVLDGMTDQAARALETAINGRTGG